MSVRLNEDKEIVAKIREGLKRKGRALSLQAGGLSRHQMYLSGVSGSDRRPQLRWILPLYALL